MRSLPRARAALAAAVLVPCTLSLLVAQPADASPAGRSTDTVGGPQLAGRGEVVGLGGTPLPDVAATSWVVADADTGEVLAARAPHLEHRPASTLKTLTAVTLMPRLDPAAEHQVTAQEMAPVYGSRAGIVAGATYTIDDLWHALLLPSGNDAAAALAGAYGGRKKTVAAMNAEAKRLRADDTHAVNPSGLDADGQVTSAYDMALFARAAIAMPEFVRVSGTVSYELPGAAPKPGKERSSFRIYGQNRLLNDGYKGVIAGKTGYTSLAGRTFWVAARRGGHTVIVTLMGVQEATETAAAHLMTWGLHNAGATSAVGSLVDPVAAQGAASGDPSAPATHGGGSGASGSLGATGAQAAPGTSPSPVLLTVGVLAALLVLGALVLSRSRARAASGAAPAPDDPAPAEPAGPASSVAAPAAAPTGNVTVIPPPQRPTAR